MKRDPLRVVTLADDAYAMPLAVMVRSLLENHRPGRALQLTVIDGGISSEARGRLEASWRDRADQIGASWRFVPPSFSTAEDLPVWGRVPRLSYARIALDDYFTGGRVVLLDSDTLVLTDLSPLHDVDLEGAIAGATRDPYIPVVSAIDGLAKWRELDLPPQTPYFNCGVMTVDVDAWIENRVTSRAFDYVGCNGSDLRQYDQDAVNVVLVKQWKELDGRWQAHPRTRWAVGRPTVHDPWIVHFSGRLKPWAYQAGTELDRLFFEYLGRTAWRGFRPPRSLAALALQCYDSPLRRILYPLETRLLPWKRRLELS